MFGKDGVAHAAQVNKVNGSKFYNGGIPNSRPFGHSFRPLLFTSTGGFRGRNSKGFRPAFMGFSKGYGKGSSYRTVGGQGYDNRPPFRGGTKGRGAFQGVRTFGRQARAAGSPRAEARAAHTLSFQAKAMSAMVAAACRASSHTTHRKGVQPGWPANQVPYLPWIPRSNSLAEIRWQKSRKPSKY